jgi:hypothetical protein
MSLAYAGHLLTSTVPIEEPLLPLRGEDAGDSGEVVADANIFPSWGVEQRLNGGEAVVAEFEDEEAAGFEMRGGLGDEIGVEFVAFLAAVKGHCRLVLANFAHEGFRCAAPDVGWITRDQIKQR